MSIVLHDLLGYDSIKIYQDEESFRFSLDSVLLADFVYVYKKCQNIMDLCTGNAPIPMILSLKTKKTIIGVEIQKDIYDLAIKSVEYNKLSSQITIINEDVNNLPKLYKAGSFDLLTCNPPYFKYLPTSNVNKNDKLTIARHEVCLKLEEMIKVASYLLNNKGVLCFSHRVERLDEIISLLSKYNFAVKKMRLVYAKENTNAEMVLIEAHKNGMTGSLHILPPLYVHKDGKYTNEILEMFKLGMNKDE